MPGLSCGWSGIPIRFRLKIPHRDLSLEHLGSSTLARSLGNVYGKIAHIGARFALIVPQIRQKTAGAARLGIETPAAMDPVLRVRKRDFEIVPAPIEGNLRVIVQDVSGAKLGRHLGERA